MRSAAAPRTVVVDGTQLSVTDIVAVARGRAPVRLARPAMARARDSAAFARRMAAVRPVYGQGTGVGANRNVPVTDPAVAAQQLLRSHATAAGDFRSRARVRAMLVVRLNQLAAGGSGVSPEILCGLAALLRDDTLPLVREVGGIGTGDLAALATTALSLAGIVPTSPPTATLTRVGAADALPLMSSNAATLGDAALAFAGLRELEQASLVVAALSFNAVAGNPEAFAAPVEIATPFPGAAHTCTTMRRLIEPSAAPVRIQDPYGLRALPQVHGLLVDSLTTLDTTVTRMANAPSENPTFLPAVGMAHHGAFYAAYLAHALDAVRQAVAQAARLSLARLAMLTDPEFTNCPAFLGDGNPGASGIMALEYLAASAQISLQAGAQPAGLHTAVLSQGVEEEASFATLAAQQALRSIEDYRLVIACELVAAVRCLRMRAQHLSPALAEIMELCADLDDDFADRDLTGDLEVAARILQQLGDDCRSAVA